MSIREDTRGPPADGMRRSTRSSEARPDANDGKRKDEASSRDPSASVRPLVRGACPGLSTPLLTGDGLLVRFMPALPVPLEAFLAFCEAARRHGNGTVEISARGSVQVRGLTADSAPAFAADFAALGIAADDGVPIVAGPLDEAADALIAAASLAVRLRRAVADAALVLAPKVCVVVDHGGHLHLDALSADVRLRAVGPPEHPRLGVAVGGAGDGAIWLGTIAQRDATEIVLALLGVIAACGPAARAADVLRGPGIGAFTSVTRDRIAPGPGPPPRRPAAGLLGCHRLRDGTVALGIALAFGHAHADALSALARCAGAQGASAVRPAPERALMLIGLPADAAAAVSRTADDLGFVKRADDPRRRIVACPGRAGLRGRADPGPRHCRGAGAGDVAAAAATPRQC